MALPPKGLLIRSIKDPSTDMLKGFRHPQNVALGPEDCSELKAIRTVWANEKLLPLPQRI